MANIKVACPKCGQKVSGDESFFGTTVECPVCSATIQFPDSAVEQHPGAGPVASVPEVEVIKSEGEGDGLPPASNEEVIQMEQIAAETRSEVSELESESDEVGEVPSPMFGAISMVSAVLGIVTCFGGPLFAPIAIIFGHMAGARARRSPVQPAPGQTLGAVGMMIGYVNLVFTIIGLIVLVFLSETEVIPDGFIRGMIPGVESAE
ncbi:MAG: hypothetical protein CMO47_14320 [Verrucomicrobiales bacterium]|nr:hypothetical protein [Verrucomicrobiales bacterium]|tara:strand:- start:15213 stop:15830 length:618 start_codon:yes stop_codon:yes gene_type:complete